VRPHLLCIGGDTILFASRFALRCVTRLRISAAGTGNPSRSSGPASISSLPLLRFVDPLADWTALKAISKLIADVRPPLFSASTQS